MCVFTDKVDKVSDTNIFGALVAPYTQITVYTNKVALANSSGENMWNSPTMFNSNIFGRFPGRDDDYHSSLNTLATVPKPNDNVFWENQTHWSALNPDSMQMYDNQGEPVAMVLAVPLPNGDVNSIKMVNMSECKDFFTQLRNVMPMEMSFSAGSYSVKSANRQSLSVPLPVKRCGPYSYSIVPDVESFVRLKQNVYKVNPRVFSVMKQHYPRGYAFLVCIIDKSAQYSPIAYVHPSDGKNIFIPTLHEHGHPGEEVFTHDWDHEIYTIDRDPGTRLTDKRAVQADITRGIATPMLGKFPYKNLEWSNLKRRTVTGYNPNGDILVKA